MTLAKAKDDFETSELSDLEEEMIGDNFKALEQELYGREFDLELLIRDLKLEIINKRLKVPTKKGFLLKFIRAGSMTVEGAVKVLESYIKFRIDYKDLFTFPGMDELRMLAGEDLGTVLPGRDQKGRRVNVIKMGKWQPDRVTEAQVNRIGFLCHEMLALEPKTQEAFPLWFREFHIINASYVAYYAHSIIKNWLPETLRDKVFFHDSLTSLHEHISPTVLPTEYGGEAGEMDSTSCMGALEQIQDYFSEMSELFQ